MAGLTAYDKFIQQALKYGFSLFGLPKTGQTIVYSAEDDGDIQAGYPKSGARFVDNGDGTITDKATGLMWPADSNGVGCNGGASKTWTTAMTWARGLVFAGYSDWRLPNVYELQSIINYARINPCIDTTFFLNTKDKYYWSSTTKLDQTTYKMPVHFGAGYSYWGSYACSNYLRAVRGGI